MKINILGESIEYSIEDNDKPIVLFIHGLNSNKNFMYGLLSQKRDYRIASFDMPCNGSSTCIEKPSVERYQAIAMEIVKYINEDLIVLGHSLGGASAAYTGTNTLVKKVIMLSPLNPFITEYSPTSLGEWLSPKTTEIAEDSLTNLVSKTSKREYFASVAKQAIQFSSFAYKNRDTLRYLIKEQILNEKYLIENLLPLYKLVSPKTIYINGTEDKFVPYKATKETADLTSSIIHTIEHCGHAPIYEKPSEVNEIINGLLA